MARRHLESMYTQIPLTCRAAASAERTRLATRVVHAPSLGTDEMRDDILRSTRNGQRSDWLPARAGYGRPSDVRSTWTRGDSPVHVTRACGTSSACMRACVRADLVRVRACVRACVRSYTHEGRMTPARAYRAGMRVFVVSSVPRVTCAAVSRQPRSCS